jgi:hypothetical protein
MSASAKAADTQAMANLLTLSPLPPSRVNEAGRRSREGAFDYVFCTILHDFECGYFRKSQ